jgi:uncharacterized repeat protein (TIGR01451 family)
MAASKSADKADAKAGDAITYTVTVGNEKTATANLRNAVMTDTISEYMSFVPESVEIDGVTAKYSYDSANNTLSVQLGNITAGQTKTITFTVVIKDTVSGQALNNTAVISADNHSKMTVTDEGVTVNNGKPELTATKSVDKPVAKVGDILTYTITANNAETAAASAENAGFSDVISEYLSFIHGSVLKDGVSSAYAYDVKTKELSVEIGDLDAGQTKAVTFSAIINADAYGAKFNNSAVISSDNSDALNIVDDGVTVENGKPALVAAKKADKAAVKVGDTVKYTITAKNAENATASVENVVLTDNIPDCLTFTYGSVQVDGTTSQYSYDDVSGRLSVSVGDIGVGQTKVITFMTVVENNAYGKRFSNIAALTSDNNDDTAVIDDGVAVEDGTARMSVTKNVDKESAKVGDMLTYTITAGNAETATVALKNVIMKDTIPEYLTFAYGSVQIDGVSAVYSYNAASKQLSVSLGDIAPGAAKTVTFAAYVNADAYGQFIKNTAVISGDNADDKTASDMGVTVGDGTAIMTAAKSVDKSAAKVGDTLTYAITAANVKNATVSLRNVIMRDIVPDYVTFTQGSVQAGGVTAPYSYDSSIGLLSVELGEIAPGETKTVTFMANINENAYGKKFNNVAVLSADNDSDKTVADTGVTVEDGTAIMTASKSVNKSTAKVGDTLTYTVTAANAANATVNLRNVKLNDTISGYLTFTPGGVLIDGYTAKYSYDNGSRKLSVELGEISPGQTKTITFSCVVNSTAYGKSFTNTAELSAGNDGDKTATDNGVTVDEDATEGTAEGMVGAKTVSSPTAKAGDTLTYAITLRNASTATAAWTNVKISDVIPEYSSFVNGSVEENGRASANSSYNASAKTLTLFADSIAPGETKTFTFKAAVQDGAQGKYIVNTAVVESDGREAIQLPDTGVQIEAGNTAPYITKTASVKEASPGDIFTYTVTVKNGIDATAAWKNVILSDLLPAGVKLVSGSVTLNGKTVSYGIAGQAIEVTVGDLKPGGEAVITFDVRTLDSAAGTTFTNVAAVKGDNGEKTATDNGVTVPKPETLEETPGNPPNPEKPDDTVTGSKTVDKTIVNTGEKVKYTITAVNNTEETWTGAQIYDVLDTSVLTFIDDSVYLDGIRYLGGTGKWTFTNKQLVVNLGDIAAGKTVKCEFTVQFKNDAVNSTYTNHSTIRSINKDSVYVKSPEVVIMGGGGSSDEVGGANYSEIHYRLFIGYADETGASLYQWMPNDNVWLDHICIIGYRMMTDYYRSSLGNGTVTVPNNITGREAQFFISNGIISASEYEWDVIATQSQIYRILNYAIGAKLSSNSAVPMSRTSVASLICDLTGRDKNPNTNGLPVTYFSDKGLNAGLIDEVSNSHDYTMDSNGKETWVSILND